MHKMTIAATFPRSDQVPGLGASPGRRTVCLGSGDSAAGSASPPLRPAARALPTIVEMRECATS